MTSKRIKVYVLNTGGTLGMTGTPMRPAKSAVELLDGIIMPPGIELTLVDFPSRQDSTNIMHRDRLEMARMIEAAYLTHDAFVVMHGTDSLAETCAFFTMVFGESLQKPLFVVGAQMGKDESGNDVKMQLENTFRVARVFAQRRLVGVFNVCIGSVLHGARIRKRNEADFDAFHTPGMLLAASAYPNILIYPGVRRMDPRIEVQGLRLDTEFEQHVVSLVASADTPPYVLMDMVKAGRVKGVILECKGAGQIPDRVWSAEELGSDKPYSWIDAIRAATDVGIHVGIISPFEDGRVNLHRYELGEKAAEAGAISLHSLTPPMGDVKFRMALAKYPGDPERIERYLCTDLIGELLPGFEDEDDGDE